MAAKDGLLAWPLFPTRSGESSFMLMKTLAALAFTTGVILSGSAPADPAKFDGTWSEGFTVVTLAPSERRWGD